MRGLMSLLVAFVLLISSTCYGQFPYQIDTRPAPYIRYSERHLDYSNRYATSPPRIYAGGMYLGELSPNRYAPESVSNPYGRYGSRYSPDSVNNIYGPYGRYSTQPIYVYPRR